MATNYTISEMVEILKSDDMGKVKEIVRKYPLTAVSLLKVNSEAEAFLANTMGLSSGKSIEKRLVIAYGLKNISEDTEEEGEPDIEEAEAPKKEKKSKRGRKPKKVVEPEEEEEIEEVEEEEEEEEVKPSKKAKKAKKEKKAKKVEEVEDDDDDFDFDED